MVGLPESAAWRDVLAGRDLGPRGREIAAAELLADFPVALLAGEG
jgi:maltooligosyltrehalose synthase